MIFRWTVAFLLGIAWTAPTTADTWCGGGASSIPDDGQSTRSWFVDVDYPIDHVVSSLMVRVEVAHPWVGDLGIVVTSPDGTECTLLDRPGLPDDSWIGPWGCGGDDLDVQFDDAAPADAEGTCSQWTVPVLSGSLRPFQPLIMLEGHPADGTWRIDFRDFSPIDAGVVQVACLEMETSPDCNANGVPDEDDVSGGGSSDDNGDGVPDECQCQADLDDDGMVNVNDVLVLIGQFGSPGTADLDGDGAVDSDDLLLVLAAWGSC